jgi:hypothetical protein
MTDKAELYDALRARELGARAKGDIVLATVRLRLP